MAITRFKRTVAKQQTSSPRILELEESFHLHLRARRRSASTIRNYRAVLHTLSDFLTDAGLPQEVGAVTPVHLEAFITDQLNRCAPGTVRARHGWLHAFFSWCVDAGECETHPMARVHRPAGPDEPPPMPVVDEVKLLLASCAGRDFADRRDRALFYTLIDTGMRRCEVSRLTWADIDFASGRVTIRGKRRDGQDRTRYGHLAANALGALDAYRRARLRHSGAERPAVFLSQHGQPLTGKGVYQIVRRPSELVGPSLL